MARLFGRNWTRAELCARTGDLSSLGGIDRLALDDGAGRGMRLARLRTGSGLDVEVLLDRGLDLGRASFGGVPLAFRSFSGDAHPAFYEPHGLGWLRGFSGGLLTTCGLSNVGAPCSDEGQDHGLHGRISHAPAADVNCHAQWAGDELCFSIGGTLREGTLFGPNLVLRRTISFKLGSSALDIHDTIANEGFSDAAVMVLYHINAGFPLVDDGARLLAASRQVTPRDATAEAGLAGCKRFEAPQRGYQEQVFYHDMTPGPDGRVRVALASPPVNGTRHALLVEYYKSELPRFVQWKMMGQGAYVCGLEPANCGVGGRAAERQAGTLEILKPGQEKSIRLTLTALDDVQAIGALERDLK